MSDFNLSKFYKEIPQYQKLIGHFGEEMLLKLLVEVLIISLTLGAVYLTLKILKIVDDKLTKTKNSWDDIIIKAIKIPSVLAIITVGAVKAAEYSGYFNSKTMVEIIRILKEFSITIAVSWFFVAYVNFYEKRVVYSMRARGEKVDYGTIDGIAKLIKFLIALAALIATLDILGVNVKGIMAAAGIGGIALGFASRDLLANFFGTTIIYLDKPFTIGDWIKSPDKDIEGTVEEIGWRLTKIRRFDKRPIYVPNSSFSTIAIENPSRMTHRRIRAVIGIRYQDIKSLPKITDEVREMLIAHPEIDTNQTLIVYFEEFANWSVNFMVYTFTYTTNWIKFYEIRQDVMMKIADIIKKHKASIAFPTSTIELSGSVKGFETN